jgi:hypothetical protein
VIDEVLRRLLTSPYARRYLWDASPVIGLAVGDDRWRVADRAIHPWSDGPVDAWISASPADLSAMLARRVPPGTVAYRMGDRDVAPRLRQAVGLVTLAALGWAGPWPDPDADRAHVPLLREALFDLRIGPADGRAALFGANGPPGLEHVELRVTDAAAHRTVTTVGLSDAWGEVLVELPPRAPLTDALRPLRAAALFVVEMGDRPPLRADLGGISLRFDPHPAFADGLPLPHRRTWALLVRA